MGGEAKIAALSPEVRSHLEEKLESEARELFDDKIKNVLKSREGKTIVIEFSRGGPVGVRPLPEHYGYAGSLPCLSDELLKRAAILYIWVTPEESRRKNRDRARPGEDKSILFHGTPESVMLQDYGSDDMLELMEASDRENMLKIVKGDRVFYVPVSRSDDVCPQGSQGLEARRDSGSGRRHSRRRPQALGCVQGQSLVFRFCMWGRSSPHALLKWERAARQCCAALSHFMRDRDFAMDGGLCYEKWRAKCRSVDKVL